jgi:hypothetical protein
LTVLTSKNFQVQATQRKFIDLPGDNKTRGLNAVPLLPGIGSNYRLELSPRIMQDVRLKILAASEACSLDDDDDDQCIGFPKASDDAELGGAPETPRATVPEDPFEPEQDEHDVYVAGIFPWSMCELLHREFLNMWQPTTSVHFFMGNGQEALAHVRSKINLVAFGATAEHITFVKEYCVASIISEQLNGVDDGFKSRRFLTRVESLGGTSSAAAATEDQATDTAATPPTGASKPEPKAVASSSGSSESS